MNFDFNGYTLVSIEPFRLNTPTVTVGRPVRLSRKAFKALGRPRFVILNYDRDERTLSIRKCNLEEGQLRPLEPMQGNSTQAIGTVNDSLCITGISSFHNMLRKQFKGDYRFKMSGEAVEDSLVFHLDDAVIFMGTGQKHVSATS
jgi:hypothetical protein